MLLPIPGMVLIRRLALTQSMTRVDLPGGGGQIVWNVVPLSPSLVLVLVLEFAHQSARLNFSPVVPYPSAHSHSFLDSTIQAHVIMLLDSALELEQKYAPMEVYPNEEAQRGHIQADG